MESIMPHDGLPASPQRKKKLHPSLARPNPVRQMLGLPAIHQFEPVRTSAPHVGPSPEQRMPSSRPSMRSQPETAGSPRLRPQPPPPAGISSRADRDLFRYSQRARQRMSIRPLFEQRREDEQAAAAIARMQEAERSEQSSVDHDRNQEVRKERLRSVERAHSEGEPIRNNADVKGGAGSADATRSPRKRIADLRERSGQNDGAIDQDLWAVRREDEDDQPSGVRAGSEWSHGQSPPSAHGREDQTEIGRRTGSHSRSRAPPCSPGPSRKDILQHEDAIRNSVNEVMQAAQVPNPIDQDAHAPSSMGEQHNRDFRCVDDTSHLSLEGSSVSSNTSSTKVSSSVPTKPQSVEWDIAGYHYAFLESNGPKLSAWRTMVLSNEITRKPEHVTNARCFRNEDAPICHKVLWKDRRQSVEGHSLLFSVLLSSVGNAHVVISPTDHEPTGATPNSSSSHRIEISEEHLALSAKLRRDLPILTPRWAEWVLSNVHRDDCGTWFLRLEDIFAVSDEEASCCFSEEVSIDDPFESSASNVMVSMHVLGGDTLLVHARSSIQASPSMPALQQDSALESDQCIPLRVPMQMTEIVLKYDELLCMATQMGFATNDTPNDITVESDADRKKAFQALVRNREFLLKVAKEGKALRLARRSGLHEPLTSLSIGDHCIRGLIRQPSHGNEVVENVEGTTANESCSASDAITMFEECGLSYATEDIQQMVRPHKSLAKIAFLSQAYTEDAILRALRWTRRGAALAAYVNNRVQSTTPRHQLEVNQRVLARIETAKQAKFNELAILSLIEDMIADLIAIECRMQLQRAKTSGGFDDHFASKVQAVYRMSTKRRDYLSKKNVRMRAARLIQALQRGIISRRRYGEMRVEREKYLVYGFRSSLQQATAGVEDPRRRANDIARETEKRRQTFLMQVIHGYVAEHGLTVPCQLSVELVQHLLNQYGVVVGCSPTLGDAVAVVLSSEYCPRTSESAPRCFTSPEINAALVLALRGQYDDTFGLSASIRQVEAAGKLGSPQKLHQPWKQKSPAITSDPANIIPATSSSQLEIFADENTPPRWLLKMGTSFHRANRNRMASLRLTKHAAGQRAAHLVAIDYRNLLLERFNSFESCRAAWETAILVQRKQTTEFDAFTVDRLVQYALDRLLLAVKDWGLDPEPLFEALNLCLLHRLGKTVVAKAESGFNDIAAKINALHGKQNVLTLRDEIAQELEQFEALLATRCLNIAHDNVATVAPSELLHVLLHGTVHPDYLRHALPAVLCIASIAEKHALASKMMTSYSSSAFGEAFNTICMSCLDTAENVTVEAAQFTDRITRHSVEDKQENHKNHDSDDTRGFFSTNPHREEFMLKTVAARALYLLTGSHALRFLQFLTKVAHFNRAIQGRVLTHLRPYAAKFELYRFASVVCALERFDIVTQLYDNAFTADKVYSSTRFWVHYETLFGLERAEHARSENDSHLSGALSPASAMGLSENANAAEVIDRVESQ